MRWTGGIWILDPRDRKLGRIVHGAPATTNLAFGGNDWKTLYFTTRTQLGSVNCEFPACERRLRKDIGAAHPRLRLAGFIVRGRARAHRPRTEPRAPRTFALAFFAPRAMLLSAARAGATGERWGNRPKRFPSRASRQENCLPRAGERRYGRRPRGRAQPRRSRVRVSSPLDVFYPAARPVVASANDAWTASSLSIDSRHDIGRRADRAGSGRSARAPVTKPYSWQQLTVGSPLAAACTPC